MEEKMSPATKGTFISFEGIDGSGKTLQAESLSEKLRSLGYSVLHVRDPGGPSLSEKIRDIILDRLHYSMVPMTEFLLYEAARSQLVTEVIQPALNRGEIVISDRFTDSTVAYQGYGRSIRLNDIRVANQWVCGKTFPDRTYILDISWEESISRLSKSAGETDRMEKEKKTFFQKVREGYRTIASEEPERVRLLDGMKSVEFLEQEILKDAINIIDMISSKTEN